jgi:nucleotide-binding universal stress UspA family protein
MPLYRSILIPTDGSATAQSGVVRGLELARLMNTTVTIISIVDVKATASLTQGLGAPDVHSYQLEASETAAAMAMAAAKKQGVIAESIVRRGSPALDIIEESAHHDLVVMASRGRTGVGHALLGSVAEKVVRFAECPVMVIKTMDSD